jgi:hypothetical protein
MQGHHAIHLALPDFGDLQCGDKTSRRVSIIEDPLQKGWEIVKIIDFSQPTAKHKVSLSDCFGNGRKRAQICDSPLA